MHETISPKRPRMVPLVLISEPYVNSVRHSLDNDNTMTSFIERFSFIQILEHTRSELIGYNESVVAHRLVPIWAAQCPYLGNSSKHYNGELPEKLS